MEEALKINLNPEADPPARQPLSVTVLTQNLKRCLDDFFPDTWVVGEISSFSEHRLSRHWYFQIKDAHAVLGCTMFRGRNQKLGWKPQIGDQVLLIGSVEIYAPQGSYSLNVRELRAVGEGAHRQKVEALKQRLQAEGLLDPRRKRPLPAMPRAIGIATSGSGAAFHDIRKVLDARFPQVTLYLVSCKVQGQGAAEDVARAIALLNAHGKSEVLIVGRGGGSREDLAAFDEEVVARAIVASRIPVVSAVGHEIDVSVADLVADCRAATPSHAAELVVPERAALLQRLRAAEQRLVWSARNNVGRRKQALKRIHLHSPVKRIHEARLRTDDLHDRLQAAFSRALSSRKQGLTVARLRLRHPRQRLDEARLRQKALHEQVQQAMLRELAARQQILTVARLRLRDPRPRLASARQQVQHLHEALHTALTRLLRLRRQRLAAAVAQLQALSPLAVLSRGYALALHDGKAVRDAHAELAPGDTISLRFAQGQALAQILSTDDADQS